MKSEQYSSVRAKAVASERNPTQPGFYREGNLLINLLVNKCPEMGQTQHRLIWRLNHITEVSPLPSRDVSLFPPDHKMS